jgi:uncharacterized phiE125 gp8 family phage protein
MAMRLITGPSSEPLTLTEAKAHLRVTTTDDDTYITALIVAAREAAEQRLGRALFTQTWLRTLDAFPDAIILRRSPIQSINWIRYLDGAGALQTLSTAAYATDFESEPGYVVPAFGYTWPVTYAIINAVSVQYIAGYSTTGAIPQTIKQWLLMRIGALYEVREAESGPTSGSFSKPSFVDGLLERYWLPEQG